MAKPRVTLHQRNALIDCRKAGKLVRRRDGWATSPTATGAHGFQTVLSLVDRDLLSRTSWQRGKNSPLTLEELTGARGLVGRRGEFVQLTEAGREALK